MADLEIRDLTVEVEGTEILHGVDIDVNKGETHALMGPNGSGKSTLAYAIMGHPNYALTGGSITCKGEDVTAMTPDERARLGMFLAMQYPTEVPGVSLTNFLRQSVSTVRGEDVPVRQFMKELREQFADIGMDEKFLQRNINEGFSGGEKKRFEILQMAMLKPEIAVLDETDSGLDIDAVRIVAEGVNRLSGPDLGTLIITHYTRILRYITPDKVHVMYEGRIVQSGGRDLADELEEKGYEHLKASA
ncbi:Fe-S cluster assembly ATPase SufC [Egibacter rhizosphaerae]|uniref:Fe-S cluster assembly ATPase SufC n=1 Tax=Egibacter rhizosphaerae TaxID=1670831 RepID=A0A411YJJ8_9ACTN|nr:Fe-S cluster assembly ATPase SufC [Egibacter rhizosphaerae]QBI21407.1 Fe-S cluster assembly ATPase SufC [Egibacter rhizosphaerae]